MSSLGLYVQGPSCHKKIRQLNKLIREYGVNVFAGCKTCTDWQFVENKEDRFCNLFGNGQTARGIFVSNTNDRTIRQDQWGGTCITVMGWFLLFVTAVGTNATGLRGWSWVHVGGGSRNTWIITAYQPCNTKKRQQWEKQCGTSIQDTLRHGGKYGTPGLCSNRISLVSSI
jgi:hypothetical protein